MEALQISVCKGDTVICINVDQKNVKPILIGIALGILVVAVLAS